MKFNLIDVFGIIAIIQSLLLALYLMTLEKGNRQSNKILAVLLFIYVIYIPSSLIMINPPSTQYVIIAYICYQVSLLIGPFIYFYFNSIFDEHFKLGKKHIIHHIPCMIIASHLFIHFYILENSYASRILSERNISIIFLLQNSLYLISSFKKFSAHKNVVNNKKQKPLVIWLTFLLATAIILWLINIHIFIIFELWNKYVLLSHINVFALFIMLNTIVFFALKNTEIFTAFGKYEKSSLTLSEKQKYTKKLLSYMENEKPYLNPLLTLSDLSTKLVITRCHLSQIINESFHQHYNDFINNYRIQASQRLLKDPSSRELSILEIAYKVGYNSKSAFNRAFKKLTGQTPSEFRNNNHPD